MNDEQLIVELGERGYPIWFRNGATAELAARVAELAPTGRAVIITDAHVGPLHAGPVAEALRDRGLAATVLEVPAGEAHKTLETVAGLYDRCLTAGVDRVTPVVALGGGVVGDLAGFVAATLLRGLPWVQAPTSVLAQVDACVGGKTGVDHLRGRNLIGAFHQPCFVLADAAWLATLPPREVRAGLAEVVKHAALAEPALLDRINALGPRLRDRDVEALRAVIVPAVQVKVQIVAADEREEGPRMVLNLGHTLGHALEAVHGPERLRHGEAVALGTSCAAELSRARGWLSGDELFRLHAALIACGLPTDWRGFLTPAVLDQVAMDKKVRGDQVNYILLHGLGDPRIVPMPLAELRDAVQRLAAE